MLTAARGLGVAVTEHGTAILDPRSGRAGVWVFLDPAAARVWETVTRTGEIDELIAAVSGETGMTPDDVRQAARPVVDDLVRRGLLHDGRHSHRPGWLRRKAGR